MWNAPDNSKLYLELRAESSNKMIIGLDEFVTELVVIKVFDFVRMFAWAHSGSLSSKKVTKYSLIVMLELDFCIVFL